MADVVLCELLPAFRQVLTLAKSSVTDDCTCAVLSGSVRQLSRGFSMVLLRMPARLLVQST